MKVVNIHRAGAGAFEGLVANHLGEYLSNTDAKVGVGQGRERERERDSCAQSREANLSV